MKKDTYTELVFILDKSGSMAGLEDDTIGGFNSMLKEQKEAGTDCRVTTILFNHSIDLLHDRMDLRAVAPMTARDYRAGGSTALLDAIGFGIKKADNVMKNSIDDCRADKVMFVIITDGYENSSRRYSAKEIKRTVESRREEGWEFIFLGANIDAVETAESYGFDRSRTADYVPDERGTSLNFSTLSKSIEHFAVFGAICDDDLDEIRSDHKKRSRK